MLFLNCNYREEVMMIVLTFEPVQLDAHLSVCFRRIPQYGQQNYHRETMDQYELITVSYQPMIVSP